MPTKRKLAIWLSWKNFSEYHSEQMAAAIADYYDTTITYDALDWDMYDIVLCFFPGRNPNCEQKKIAKFVWEPHEYGLAEDAGMILAASTLVYDGLKNRYGQRMKYLPWGINPEHFYQQPLPKAGLVIGWVGTPGISRKRFDELAAEMAKLKEFRFMPNKTWMVQGERLGNYDLPGINEYYKLIHVYACGSASEGFGFPFLEASACGRPIVTFDVGCARDLKKTGAAVFIVHSWKEMRETIQEIDFEVSGSLSEFAVEKHWTWEVLKDKWLKVLDDVGS